MEVEYPPWLSAEALDLLRRLLVADPTRRLPLAQAQSHSWMTASKRSRTTSTWTRTTPKRSDRLVVGLMDSDAILSDLEGGRLEEGRLASGGSGLGLGVEEGRLEGRSGLGLGMGEIPSDEPGEGDGCDRCGLPDEEACCPSFWADRGVPPIWPLSWVFDPRNRYLNDNSYARVFGNVGFPHFDRERKACMGVALAVTLLAICVTGFGCFALNGDPFTLRFTAWGVAHTRMKHAIAAINSTTAATTVNEDDELGQVSYIGLRRFVVRTCSHVGNRRGGGGRRDWHEWSSCDDTAVVWWDDAECADGEESLYGFPCDAVATCQQAAINNQVGAFMTCVTLLFAIIGCLTRSKCLSLANYGVSS